MSLAYIFRYRCDLSSSKISEPVYNVTPCHPPCPHSSDNICIVPVQSGRPLRPSLLTDASREKKRERARAGGGRPRKSIYLFIYVPRGAWIDEGMRDAAYSRRMHRTGNPTGERPCRMRGWQKSRGTHADTRLRRPL